MFRVYWPVLPLSVVAIIIAGCSAGVVPSGAENSGSASEVAAKAINVAANVGGESGYGGTMMNGYSEHMPENIGFDSRGDLASSGLGMTVHLSNQSQTEGTFHLNYFASHMGFDELSEDVIVAAGEDMTVSLPCVEIIGLGPLDEPGQAGCHLADGEAIPNTMAVPGFLGQDFECGQVYECILSPDVDDLDGDGDTEELIIISDAMEFHMTDGGPTGHMHGNTAAMMGPHMGF